VPGRGGQAGRGDGDILGVLGVLGLGPGGEDLADPGHPPLGLDAVGALDRHPGGVDAHVGDGPTRVVLGPGPVGRHAEGLAGGQGLAQSKAGGLGGALDGGFGQPEPGGLGQEPLGGLGEAGHGAEEDGQLLGPGRQVGGPRPKAASAGQCPRWQAVQW